MSNSDKIRVMVCGAAGRMGQTLCGTILKSSDMELAAAVDVANIGKDIGILSGFGETGVTVQESVMEAIDQSNPHVCVDFTKGPVAGANIIRCIQRGVACVVGTTGFSDDDMKQMEMACLIEGVPLLIVPNFSVGAVLMMQFAKQAACHLEWAEITELHHEKKADAPSGTAMRTADMMAESRESFGACQGEEEKVEGARGGLYRGIRLHSVRLPGLLAHQEVRFGALGETLTIRHDSISRECFMPGVMLAIRQVRNLSGLVIGLEKVMQV